MNPNNSKALEMIRNNIKSTLKDYEKIIQVGEEDLNYFEAEPIQSKLKKIEVLLKQAQANNKNTKKEESRKQKDKYKDGLVFDLSLNDDFRNYNIYIPKIKLSETTLAKTTFSLHPMLDFKTENSIVFNAIDNNLQSEFKFRKLDRFQKYKPDPLFFSNKYLEFDYTDISEKNNYNKKNENVLFNALKNTNHSNLSAESVYIPNKQTPLYNSYSDLLKWEERSIEIENNFLDKLKDDELIYDPKEENEEGEKKKKSEQMVSVNTRRINIKIDNQDKDKDKIYNDVSGRYKKWILSTFNQKLNKTFKKKLDNNTGEKTNNNTSTLQNNILKQNSNPINLNTQPINSTITTLNSGVKIVNILGNDNNTDEKHSEDKYDHMAITFGISIQGVIDKRIRQTSQYHTRGLLLEGPIATWVRFKNDVNTHITKGLFDLRKKENKMNHDDVNEKKIIIRKYQEDKHLKEIEKEIEFKSDAFKEFSGKSFKEVFTQIRTYYHFINTMKSRVDYTKLKFFSDPNIINYTQSPLDSKYGLIENLDWHLKLKNLHLRGMDKTSLKNVFSILSISDIMLESLTLESGVNSANLSNISQYEFEPTNSIRNFFLNKTCQFLKNIHLINFKFENGIKPFLDCLCLKFNFMKKFFAEDKNHNYINDKVDLPYKNITIKRKEQALPAIIDLNELYVFFNNMANVFGGIDKFKFPFEKLDISGCDTVNIEGLKNIINNFKIIKEIDLSNTKFIHVSDKIVQNNSTIRNEKNNNYLQANSFLINNLELLKSITIKHNFTQENFKIMDDTQNNLKLGNKTSFGFDYTNGLLPLLETIYLFETPITNETYVELMNLFKVRELIYFLFFRN